MSLTKGVFSSMGPAMRVGLWLFPLLVTVSCVQAPNPYRLLSQSELTRLVTNQTLYVTSCCDAPNGLMLYLTANGTGWLDRRATPPIPPSPGGMSMVFSWGLTTDSGVCFWATPLIGNMPSLMPASFQCLQIERSRAEPAYYQATVTKGDQSRTAPLYVSAFNAFPEPVISQYLAQVRVLYGGHLPTWGVPVAGAADR
jgi:hypothetical protein